MKKTLMVSSWIAGVAMPGTVFAQAITPGGNPPVNVPTNVQGLIAIINQIAGYAFGFLLVLAFIMFLIGAFTYLFGGANEDAKKKAKNYFIYGAIGIAAGFIAFGLAQVVRQIVCPGGAC